MAVDAKLALLKSNNATALIKSPPLQGGGGAKGIRTPDLLIANETRYQLRHSPEVRRQL